MSPLLSKNPILQDSKQNLGESYFQFLSELREDVSDEEVSPYLSPEFQDELRIIVNSDGLDSYSPLKFFWLNLIDKLVDTLSLVEEGVEESNELIGFFSDSDLLGFVVDLVENKEEPEDILEKIIDFQEVQIICFYMLHLSQVDWQPNGPVLYSLTPELGEVNGVLVLGEDKDIYIIPHLKGESIATIAGYFPSQKKLQVMNGESVEIISAEDTDLIINIEGLNLIPGFSKDQEIDSSHIDKVRRAIEVIGNLNTDLLSILKDFTHTIVPLYQEELVSYSMAILPGFSSINVRDRDFVDMVDDLLHENGHHFLNSILEGEEDIIYEDDDKIFYSPWRKALRPIRGLYHGVVTFYWAYRLFKELSGWEKLNNYFSEDEKEKVRFRFLEEAILLRRCLPEIQEASKLDKIASFGLSITDIIFQELERDLDFEIETKKMLSEEDLKKLSVLEKDLNSKKLI